MTTVKDDINDKHDGGSEQRVAATIHALRERSGLSLRTLATRAGFSASFISQVEHGLASPSIASLEKIVAALGVTMSEFFSYEQPQPDSPTMVRAAQRQQLSSDWSKATLAALGPKLSVAHSTIEPVMLTLSPGGRTGSTPSSHHGEEFAFVFEGSVQLVLGERVHQLSRGDAVTFSSKTPHQWENSGSENASIFLLSSRSS